MSTQKKKKSVRTRYWTSLELLRLVELWRMHNSQIESFDKQCPPFRLISSGMRAYRSHVNAQECRRKIRALRTRYLAERKRLETEGDSYTLDWPIYWFINTIYEPGDANEDLLDSKKRIDGVFERMRAQWPEIPKVQPAHTYRYIKASPLTRRLRLIARDMLTEEQRRSLPEPEVLENTTVQRRKRGRPSGAQQKSATSPTHTPDSNGPKSNSSTYSDSGSSERSTSKRVRPSNNEPNQSTEAAAASASDAGTATHHLPPEPIDTNTYAALADVPAAVFTQESPLARDNTRHGHTMPRPSQVDAQMLEELRCQNVLLAEQLREQAAQLRQEEQFVQTLEDNANFCTQQLDILLALI